MNQSMNNPPVLRQISVRAAMDLLLHEGPMSRATLAKKTGLSKQTMSEVIRTLEESGWVQVKGIVSGKVGRSAITYEVSPEAGFALGVDLGATTVRLALVNIVGTIVDESESASRGLSGAALLSLVHDLVEAMLTRTGIARDKVLLAAVATPGVVDPASGALMLAPNMGDLSGLDLVKGLSEALGARVIVENDINAAMVGESWKGCSAGIENGAFISLGTGIGLGMMINGKLMKGAHGAAGEISYLPFGADPYSGESLERGALECAIGARGIQERYRAVSGQELAVRDILERAEAGNEAAFAAIAETARLTALLVVSVDAMIDPEKIVLGGNVGRHPLMVRLICEALPSCTRRQIAVEASLLGPRATMVGAVALALNQLHNMLFSPQALPSEMRLPG
ncbi:ROK family transcriptional regulator [Rhizobium paknamense]|uniref:NBD/HSP70 family sugar kinase n=1 Tax=Rhizobium paknamense TaxID=1206817 RepID=A0ABU0IC97_9HYPH|nr:ROK family transcriptional regulator [Rhizobium paknamense]MDQ0455864.1 putative NBD/HSP70 family sugar kinase [Rhizobium paknamense]